VHRALDHYYSARLDPIEFHDRLGAEDADWMGATDQPSYALDELYSDIVIGRMMLTRYFEWIEDTGADSLWEIVSTEETIEAPILDGRVILRGKIDLKVRGLDTGFLLLNDWKTVGRWDAGQRASLERSFQHHVYMAIQDLLTPDDPVVEAWYTVLKKVKTRRPKGPVIERFKVPGTLRTAPRKRAQIEHIVWQMLRAIEERANYPSPGLVCNWCDYRMPCELQDENPVAAEEYIETKLFVGGKHSRYDADI
jgi:hypothetical protein